MAKLNEAGIARLKQINPDLANELYSEPKDLSRAKKAESKAKKRNPGLLTKEQKRAVGEKLKCIVEPLNKLTPFADGHHKPFFGRKAQKAGIRLMFGLINGLNALDP